MFPYVPDAFVYGRHFVTAVGLQTAWPRRPCTCIRRPPEARARVQAGVQADAFGLGFVHVVALAYLVESGVLVVQPHVVSLGRRGVR